MIKYIKYITSAYLLYILTCNDFFIKIIMLILLEYADIHTINILAKKIISVLWDK